MATNAEQITLAPELQDYARKIALTVCRDRREEALPQIKSTWEKTGRALTDAELEAIYEQAKALAPETFDDLARRAEENPIQWLVPQTIIEGGIHVVYGREESFKTTFAMQLLEALNAGGNFLGWNVEGGERVGFVELEMSKKIFQARVRSFQKPARSRAVIVSFPDELRRKVLNGETAKARVEVILEWVKTNRLDVIAIDSSSKLFPPTANLGSQPAVSDVFNQLQMLGCTVILLAHPKKRSHESRDGEPIQDNEDIAGSGRFAQDPDIILEMHRPDKRSPLTTISWGKNRMDFKPRDVELFFDAVDFRLYPVHPFLHLLPASREQLLKEAEKRFKWKQRTADEYIKTLKGLQYDDGRALIEVVQDGRQTIFRLASGVSLSKLVQSLDSFHETCGETPTDLQTNATIALSTPVTSGGNNFETFPGLDAGGYPTLTGEAD